MFEKPEDSRMTVDEAEQYGRAINARSAQYENCEVPNDAFAMSPSEVPPPMSEEEKKKLVGEQNYLNALEDGPMNGINS